MRRNILSLGVETIIPHSGVKQVISCSLLGCTARFVFRHLVALLLPLAESGPGERQVI